MELCEHLRTQNLKLLEKLQQQQETCSTLLSSLGCTNTRSLITGSQKCNGQLAHVPHVEDKVKTDYDGTTIKIGSYYNDTTSKRQQVKPQYKPAEKVKPGKKLVFGVDAQSKTAADNVNGSTVKPLKSLDLSDEDIGLVQDDKHSAIYDDVEEQGKQSADLQGDKPGRTALSHAVDSPKSILRRRQIIDDNIPVASKYQHSPAAGVTPRKSRLNYSYSNLDGSYVGEYCDTENVATDQPEEALERGKSAEIQVTGAGHVKRLQDAGNHRNNAAVIAEIERRQKSQVKAQQTERSQPRNMQSTPKRQSNLRLPTNQQPSVQQSTHMLGYDWIAGVMDNQSMVDQKPDEFYEELKLFRRSNREECFGTSATTFEALDLGRPITPEVSDPAHVCIHGYTVNDRLYTDAMNIDDEGNTICPVCLIPRQQPTQQSPGFVRVSIPRSTLMSPYRVKPHRRRSFDPTDSCALSQHCLSGWECSQPSTLPTASSLDLTHAVHGKAPKNITSSADAEALAQSYSRTSKLTTDLLNQSHTLRYDLQALEKEQGLHADLPANTTRYPLL